MKVTIELNDEVIEGIAYSKAVHDAYDKLSSCSDDMTAMYEIAFADGMKYLLSLIDETRLHHVSARK